jgi:hypothetical protein
MAEQHTVEERLTILEQRVAEFERFRHAQEDRDIALLARIDGFIDDLRRIERVQMRGFEELKSEQQEIKADLQEVKAEQKKAFATVADTMRDHKQALETLAAGQQQIITLLTGQAPRND